MRIIIAAIAAVSLSLAAPQQGGGTCPCTVTVTTQTSPDSDCGIIWAVINERDGQCPRDFQQNCNLMGSLGCDSRGLLKEIAPCTAEKEMHLTTDECQDTDSDFMEPSDAPGGANHHADMTCADCSP